MRRIVVLIVALALLGAACSSDDDTDTDVAVQQTADPTETSADPTVEPTVAAEAEPTAVAETVPEPEPTAEAVSEPVADPASYIIEVWADNWMAVYVNGELIGEDSVSITTERSFNSETFSFEAAAPFTLAIEAKDFKETDSGLEYIGANNQQMGDGGIIAQITNTTTGEVVAVTNAEWSALVVHRAPLNTECERDSDPNATCQFEISDTPADWTSSAFDDSGWPNATVWTAADVGPKDGYDTISWDGSAELIWGTDLEVDNTVLLRTTVTG